MGTALALGVTAALVAGCGSSSGDAGVAVETRAARSTVTVRVLGQGTNVDAEPQPRGTIVIDGAGRRHVWVQAIAAEDHARIAGEGQPDGNGVTQALGSGATRSVFRSGDQYRLVSSDGTVDPDEVAPYLFDLDALPSGMRFVPATVAASMALDVDPSVEPLDVLPEGVTAFEVEIGDETLGATAAAAEPHALVGSLLLGRQEVAPGVWSGEIAPEYAVVLLEDAARSRVVVVHQPSDPEAIVAVRSQILDQVAAS